MAERTRQGALHLAESDILLAQGDRLRLRKQADERPRRTVPLAMDFETLNSQPIFAMYLSCFYHLEKINLPAYLCSPWVSRCR